MRKHLILWVLVVIVNTSFAQNKKNNFKAGERLDFRLSYSGFFRAGKVSLELKEDQFNGKKVLHAIGKGRTTGITRWFFKVDDTYETYFEPNKNIQPVFFKRKINEGGYKKHRYLTFNSSNQEVYIKDFLKKKDTIVKASNVQDLLSCYYYLRSYDFSTIKKGDEIKVKMFFDDETYLFKLKFLGYETLKTRFGKIKSMKFMPLVQSGRVFRAEESVTLWVTADKNKIPLKVYAKLAVGSLRAELKSYKNLAYKFGEE